MRIDCGLSGRRWCAVASLAALALLPLPAAGKVWRGAVRLTHRKSWFYTTNFAFDVGKGRLEVSVEGDDPLPAGTRVMAFLDEEWDQVQAASTCRAKEKLARWDASLDPSRGWGTVEHPRWTTIDQVIRAHVWHVVVANCHTERDGVGGFTRAKFQVRVTFLQDPRRGGPHFSFEDRLPSKLIPMMLVLLSVASAYMARLFVERRGEAMGKVHPTLRMVLAALSMHIVYLAAHSLHIWVYSANGRGLRWLDVFGEVLHWAGQLTMSYVLLGLAFGWTLSSKAKHKLVPDEKETVYAMGAALALLHFLLVVMGRAADGTDGKYHIMDSIPAYLLILLRVLLLGVFLWGASVTLAAEHVASKREFLGRLMALGTLWFAAVPVLVLIAGFCAEYVREPVVTSGVVVAQSVGVTTLAWLFLTRNDYYKMSSLASQGMLPTRSSSNLMGGVSGWGSNKSR